MSLRDMAEALYPEAVGRRRAEEARALATSELRQLVPVERPSDSHQALVQVCGAAELPLPLTISYAMARRDILQSQQTAWSKPESVILV